MKLQGMDDKTFETLVNMTIDIQSCLIKAGGMATKSRVEDELMRRFDLDRGDAHTLTNFVEGHRRDFTIGHNGLKWIAKRPEPGEPCQSCGGSAFVEFIENGAPHGAGFWAMPVSDICPDCLEYKGAVHGRCPHCLTEFKSEEGPCSRCGWNWAWFE